MQLLNSIVEKARRADLRLLELDGQQMDVIIFPHRRWPRMGVVLGKEALILDYKTKMSFRVRSGNLGFSEAVRIGKCKKSVNKDFLEKYFLENQDNPYGIQNIMNLIHHGADVTTATQFPPLFLPKLTGKDRKVAIDKMVELAQKGDSVFSSHRRDAISAAIRKYDRSQFSHVAIYLGDGEVADIGPRGGEINSLYDSDDDTHFALYTFNVDVPDGTRQAVAKSARDEILKGVGFNYWGIFLMFLRKRFKLPVMRKVPSVADLLFSNAFKLVSYF
jgi:hypothetical protein